MNGGMNGSRSDDRDNDEDSTARYLLGTPNDPYGPNRPSGPG
jgi:hypothetical protein